MLQLAESYPMRRAAQLGAYLFFRSKQLRMYFFVKMTFTFIFLGNKLHAYISALGIFIL